MKINAKKTYLIFTTFYLYFIMALFESSRGNFVPFFIDEFQINNSIISLILSLNTVGCVIGSYLGGYLCGKFGHKFVFILGCVISTISVFIAPFISNIYLLGLFYFVFGLGRSSLCIAIDSLVPVLSVGFEVILMNITHFMYGFGSFIGQSIYGKLLFNGFPWRSIYLFLGIFYILSIVFTLFMKIPNINIVEENIITKKNDIYKNPVIYFFVLAVTCVLMSEAVLNTWFINYIRTSYGFNPSDAAFYASMFFLSFAIGRLLGGFIVQKLGNAKGLKIFMLLAGLFVFTGLIFKRFGIILISFSGFFLSVGFPTLMVLINKVFKQNTSYAIGIITTFSNILYVLLFNITGVFNDLLGSYKAFFVAPIFLVGSAISINIISKINNPNEIV